MKRNVEKYDYQVLNDAKNILMEIDMPKELYNPRCVMIFCACAQMIDGKSWRHISEEYMSVHDIIKYVNEVFPNKAGLDKKGYQENSRETFRDETLKRWVSAAIIESKAGLAANDRNNGYRFTSAFAALIRTYGSDQWEDSLSAFMETYESYSKKLKQVKSLPKGYDVTCGNITVKLGLSAHNKLQNQRGYKIFHNDKELSSKKDVNKVLDKMEDADNYMIEANDKNKTLNIIDP